MDLSEIAEIAAKIAVDVNAAYKEAVGESPIEHWFEISRERRQGIVGGALNIIHNPGITPMESHDAWSASMRKQGYEYGNQVDHDKKTHPCLVPYDELPAEQKAKDYLFRGTVLAVKRWLYD